MTEEPRSIGGVINLLRDEFPDVSVSKVRFLENQGMISPGRSESGYRLFYDDDIKRLRFILQQQRDHYLPLKVIKSRLTMWERGEEPVGPEFAVTETLQRRSGQIERARREAGLDPMPKTRKPL